MWKGVIQVENRVAAANRGGALRAVSGIDGPGTVAIAVGEGLVSHPSAGSGSFAVLADGMDIGQVVTGEQPAVRRRGEKGQGKQEQRQDLGHNGYGCARSVGVMKVCRRFPTDRCGRCRVPLGGITCPCQVTQRRDVGQSAALAAEPRRVFAADPTASGGHF